MNHEYVLFSKNTCQNSMVNVLDKDKILWYVMRAYKNENTAEDRLSNETYGLEYFIPKQKVLRTVKGKKVFFKEIYINGSLKFEITAKRLYAASQRVL